MVFSKSPSQNGESKIQTPDLAIKVHQGVQFTYTAWLGDLVYVLVIFFGFNATDMTGSQEFCIFCIKM